MNICDLQRQFRAGQTSTVRQVQYYLARIAELDRQGPCLRAVIECNPDALSLAAMLDAQWQAEKPPGPLHGVPILLKDNIDTGDRMATSAGSLALTAGHARQDAFLVRRLRAAGALILGKTNLSEWGNFRSTRQISGWSSRGGQTRNAYAPERTPWGSSSGSAVAVAANMCAAAIGTETDGSIVYPAAMNSLVGLKPTLGLISRSGLIPLAQSQDTAGPITRTVTDAALLLNVLAGTDPDDAATRDADERRPGDYTCFLEHDGLRGARIGVVRRFFGAHPKADRLIETALDALQDLGALLIDPVHLPDSDVLRALELDMLYYEFKDGLNRYLATRSPPTPVRSLAQLIAYNEYHSARIMPLFGQERLLLAADKDSLQSSVYRSVSARCRRLAQTQGIDAALREHRLDALLAPTTGPAWLIDPLYGDRAIAGCATPAAVAGYPHITVPAGYVAGLPIGLSFFSGAFQEPVLLRLAFAFEQATQARRAPR